MIVRRHRRLIRLTMILVVALMAASCTTNSFVIGFFYGRMDNRMNDRILEAATFTADQEAEISAEVDQFFAWHRREELPRYADLLLDIEQELANGGSSEERVLDHMSTIRRLSKTAFMRSPLANSADFLQGLSDRQVAEIAEHFKDKDERFREWLAKRDAEGGDQRRLNAIVKNVGRFGINLNTGQKQILEEALARIDSDPMDRHRLWNQWEDQLIALLQDRNQPGFKDAVTAHLHVYQDQMQIHRARESARNRAITATMIDELVTSLDARQRQILLKKLAETRISLLKLAQR